MKTKSLFSFVLGLAALLVINLNANAQSTDAQVNPRLYIVTQSAATCTMCVDNMTRWNDDVVKYYSNDNGVVFINYDITDDNTRATTRADLDKFGIYNSLDGNISPGSILVIDAGTNKVVGTTTFDKSSADILKLIGTYSGNPSSGK